MFYKSTTAALTHGQRRFPSASTALERDNMGFELKDFIPVICGVIGGMTAMFIIMKYGSKNKK